MIQNINIKMIYLFLFVVTNITKRMFNPFLTKDSALQIALKLEGKDLWNLYFTNKQLLKWIYNNEKFWNQKIKQDFDINTYETLNRSGASNDYRFLYIIQDKDPSMLNDLLISKSKTGNIDHVKLLLKKGADVYARNNYSLRWAAKNGHIDVTELLLKNGADIHTKNDDALMWAAMMGHRDVTKLLLKYGANIHADDDNDHALILAAEKGRKDVIELLLENGADIHAQNDYALRCAVDNGHKDVVELLLRMGANVHAKDDYALILAAQYGHKDVVELLLNNGANPAVLV